MLNLFKRKEPPVKIIDKVWMSELSKLNALVSTLDENNETVIIFWFEESLQKLEAKINRSATILLAKETNSIRVSGKKVIVAEHFPLFQTEIDFFNKINLPVVQVWSALDEPLFSRFGGEKIIQLMKQLGMKEDEMVEHNMISKAIRNAQDKISKKVIIPQSARSQQNWLEKNMPI